MSASNVKTVMQCHLSVDSNHPAKPGHFPGQAIVPGVLIIESVLDYAKTILPATEIIATIKSVKFHRVLKFGVTYQLLLTRSTPKRLCFSCVANDQLIAEGTLLVGSTCVE